jgi:acetylornithine deacetylase
MPQPRPRPAQPAGAALSPIDLLRTLVGFDTTSSRSNLPLIEWVKA